MNKRIEILDALRGLSIILMVAYHCGYDLVLFGFIPQYVLYNGFLNFLQPVFAGLFILLCGISSKFSKNNLKRGLKISACAVVVTLATLFVGEPVWFGILHLLAACTLLYHLFERLALTEAAITLAAFFTLYFRITQFPIPNESSDYFPLIPWVFLFYTGTYIGNFVKDGKLPRWFYDTPVPFFSTVGRHTLIIYMLHQPVLFGIVWLLAKTVNS